MVNEETGQVAEFDSLFLFNGFSSESLIIQLFDLGKLFVDKKMVTFNAQGTCMYPCIRQGDTLYLQPKNSEQMQIGEIAVYRRNNRLYSHRVIAKGADGDRGFVITRPDTSEYGDDGPVYNADILGVVAQVGRNGNTFSVLKRDYDLTEKIWAGFRLKYFHFNQRLLQKFSFFVAFLQQFKLYRLLTGVFLRNANKDMVFVFSVPLRCNMADKLYQKVSEEELCRLISGNNDNLTLKWEAALRINSKDAAAMVFRLRLKSGKFYGWWLTGAKIRIKYRGSIVEKALLDKVDSLLKRSGISRIFASVFGRSKLGQLFLRNLGFKPVDGQIMRREIA